MFRGDGRISARLYARTPTPFISILVAVMLVSAAGTSAFEPRPVPGRMILKLRPSAPTDGFLRAEGAITKTGIEPLDTLHAAWGVTRFASLFPDEVARHKLGKAGVVDELTRYYSVDFAAELDLESVRASYQALAEVELAEYDWMAPLHLQTNDSSSQWHIQTTTGRDAHVTGGWNHSTGSPNVVLAIADSGVDWMHPDLGGSGPDFSDGNIWINTAELNGVQGVDDDANGFVDDVRGWDFVTTLSRNDVPPGEDGTLADNDPMDFNGHGTHVAGIAGAITNNGIGVSGVGFNCKVMALRIGGSILDGNQNEQGVVFMSYAAQAINYARNNGASAFNASWGSAFTSFLDAAVDAATGGGDMVIVVSAGNDGSAGGDYLNIRPENDTFSVAATTSNDSRASFSNYGSWVDVAAPGVSILSTYFDHRAVGADQHTYTLLQGTSMSAPLVTGLVGLVRAHSPYLTRTLVQQKIQAGCDNVDEVNQGFEGQLGAGRVNALKTFGDYFLSVPDDYPNIQLALSQSAVGDTIALRGGRTYNVDVLLTRGGRLLQGGWDANYLSRDPGNPAIIDGSGTSAVLEVVRGLDETSILDALHFTGGAAKVLASPSGRFGGGVLCRDASPLFRDCVFELNSAGSDLEFGGGGAGFFENSSSRFERCKFMANEARAGGGVYALNSTLEFESCVFDGNTVHAMGNSRGAAIYASGGTLTMRGGKLTNGGQAADGGAVYATNAADVRVEAVEIHGNSASRGGAVALDASARLTLVSSLVHDNAATQLGGGIYSSAGNATILNTSFDSNSGAGAAIFVQDSPGDWTIRNCIIANHSSSAALLFFGSSANLDYNLFWNNSAGDVTGAEVGFHTLQADPLYVDPSSGDFALGLHSPALDSGDPDVAFADVDGTRNDRGAFGGPAGRQSAPAVPADFGVRRPDERNEVSWTAIPDVDYIAVYRSGSDPDFVPSAANFIASVPSNITTYVDVAAASSWYRVAAVDSSGASSGFTAAAQAVPTTGVDDPADDVTPNAVPFRYVLRTNVPNPFNPRTLIRFEVPEAAIVRVAILDTRGRLIRQLVQGRVSAGPGEVLWDGRDEHGRDAPSGTYVYRVSSGSWTASRKMTLLR